MIIVRNSFVAKPGQASKLAAQLKEAVTIGGLPNTRILTDMTGEFNRVIMEYEVESMGDLEAVMQRYRTDEAIKEKMKGYTDHYVTGSREILKVV